MDVHSRGDGRSGRGCGRRGLHRRYLPPAHAEEPRTRLHSVSALRHPSPRPFRFFR